MFQPVWSQSNPFITRQGLWLMLTLTQKIPSKPLTWWPFHLSICWWWFLFHFSDPTAWAFLPVCLPKSYKYILRKCLEGVKAEPQEVFGVPNTVFGRLGLYIFLWFLNAFRFFWSIITYQPFECFGWNFTPVKPTLAHLLGSSHSFSAAALRRPMVQESMPSRSSRRRRWRSPLRPRRQLQRKRRSWAKARPSQRGETDDLMEDVSGKKRLF